ERQEKYQGRTRGPMCSGGVQNRKYELTTCGPQRRMPTLESQGMSGEAADAEVGRWPEPLGGRAQREAPYLDALVNYARRHPGRFPVPGQKGGRGADPVLVQTLGSAAFEYDIPAGIEGIDVGQGSPFQHAQQLAAETWGARRSWFLISGASQGNHTACL